MRGRRGGGEWSVGNVKSMSKFKRCLLVRFAANGLYKCHIRRERDSPNKGSGKDVDSQ